MLPSVLDGGSHILLANMLNEKRLICSYNQGLARPLPTSSYALVSRDILCHCHLQVGLTYILKNIATCNVTDHPTLEYTVNLAFMDYFNHFWGISSLSHILTTPTVEEVTLPVAMKDYSSDLTIWFMEAKSKRILKHLRNCLRLLLRSKFFCKTERNFFLMQRQEWIKFSLDFLRPL